MQANDLLLKLKTDARSVKGTQFPALIKAIIDKLNKVPSVLMTDPEAIVQTK